ncbi:hypothetical protein J7E97_08200 [Streptomyces sp. ISL-66]|uniref:hypothetical protein n=1 Tax=Streptomyces sp. ISL-66 TaxID=2819186 RepID=UPI001BECA024|nr:hypothetical protein [Streptomyces sp. ISL-66]MBT2467855.1 hypothetical protein [Streptomyces sp. ISL-66]
MLIDFRLDRRGVEEALKAEPVRDLIEAKAQEVAAGVTAQVPPGVEVKVETYTTDRAAAVVLIKDVRAMAWQARDGVLTRAASSAGLEVRAWQR